VWLVLTRLKPNWVVMPGRPPPEGVDADELNAPEGWEWDVNPRVAHTVWNLTVDSDAVNFGPSPPLLLEAYMGHFGTEPATSAVNNWYFTRLRGRRFTDPHKWEQIGNQFEEPDGERMNTTARLYDTGEELVDTHPAYSQLQSQQYTITGGMFTYDFSQVAGEDVTGMMRVPIPRQLREEMGERLADRRIPFEAFQMQSRQHSGEFAEVETTDDIHTYMHPHFRPLDWADITDDDLIGLFEVAFEVMAEGVEIEMGDR
jgi:hypothetical protein